MADFRATGGISAAGAIGAGVMVSGPWNLAVTGTFDATASLEKSMDGGATWNAMAFPDGAPLVIGAPLTLAFDAARLPALVRLRALSWVSGEMCWRISR